MQPAIIANPTTPISCLTIRLSCGLRARAVSMAGSTELIATMASEARAPPRTMMILVLMSSAWVPGAAPSKIVLIALRPRFS